jgi:arylsulfatase A-like enzyme
MIFENAISQAPWTMPAFASILTGKYPRNHGATSLKGRLSKRETTLAEILRESGYWTGAVVSHMYVDALRGFSQGFDTFDESSKKAGTLGITSQKLTSTIIDLLHSRPADKPFFIFAHYFDPHYEFRNHKGFKFADDYSGWLTPPLLNIMNLRSMRHELRQRDIEHIESLYDEEISFCDQELGQLFDFLARDDLIEDTVIIVVSDHGEEFMERGWLGHTITLFDELIHVPMIIYVPDDDQRTRRISDVVETRAIYPTLLDYLEITPGSERWRTSLIRHSPNQNGDSLRYAYSEVWLPRAPATSGKRVLLSSIRTNDHKLILDHHKKRTHFFDLTDDPLEQRNLVSLVEYEEIYRNLYQLLMKTMKRMPGGNTVFPHVRSDPDLTKKLESIGYL